jgi:hypothetical protein
MLKSSLQTIQLKFLSFLKLVEIPTLGESEDARDNDAEEAPQDEKRRFAKRMFADPSDLDAYVNEYVVEKILKIEHFRSQNRIFESTDGYAIPRGNGRRGPGAREAEIDYYLENGCVLVRGLNAKEEFEVLLKFRTFLLKYGDVLNFSIPNWSNFIFLFYNNSKNDSIMKNGSLKTSKNKSNSLENLRKLWNDENNSGKDVNNDAVINFKDKYHCELKNNLYVMEIPNNFKTNKMIEFISTYIDPLKNVTLSF